MGVDLWGKIPCRRSTAERILSTKLSKGKGVIATWGLEEAGGNTDSTFANSGYIMLDELDRELERRDHENECECATRSQWKHCRKRIGRVAQAWSQAQTLYRWP